MRAWLVALVLACGNSQPAPKPVPVAPPKPAPMRATCSDVGVILRGSLELDTNDEAAGPAKERAITQVCKQDKWPQSAIDCVASTPRPTECLAKLADKQLASYEAKLDEWNAQYGAADGGYVVAPVHCDSIIGDPAAYDPLLPERAAERDWVIELRRAWLFEECDHHWSEDIKKCLNAGSGRDNARAACLTSLGQDELDEMQKKLASFDRLGEKVAAAKKKPESITCKKVVALHYGDAAWKKKLEGYKADERKKMIETSRALMLKACDSVPWTDLLRACIVVGGGETCFERYGMRLAWSYPAAGSVTSVGIKECDDYGAAVQKLAACSKIPPRSRDSLKRSFDQTQAQVAGAPAKDRAKMAPTCKAGLEAIESVAASVGC